MEVVFSQPLGLWSFCFLRVFSGLWSLCWFWLVFLFLLLVFLTGGSSWGVRWGDLLSFVRVVGGAFSGFICLANFDARSTLIHRLLRDTRHSDGSTDVVWFCHCLHRPCGLPVTGAWLSRAKEVFSLSSAWWSRSASFRRAKVVPGHWEADLLFGNSGGGACCTRAGLWRWQCLSEDLGWFFC